MRPDVRINAVEIATPEIVTGPEIDIHALEHLEQFFPENLAQVSMLITIDVDYVHAQFLPAKRRIDFVVKPGHGSPTFKQRDHELPFCQGSSSHQSTKGRPYNTDGFFIRMHYLPSHLNQLICGQYGSRFSAILLRPNTSFSALVSPGHIA